MRRVTLSGWAWSPWGPLGVGTVLGVPVPVWHLVITADFQTFSLKTQLYLDSALKTVDLAPDCPYKGEAVQGNEFLQNPHSSVEGWDENSTVALCTDGQESQWLPLSRGRGRNTGVLNQAPWLRSALPARSLRKTSGGRQKKGRQGIIFLQLRPEISNLVL